MSMVRINHHPDRRQRVVFLLAWLMFFGAIGAVVWWQGGAGAVVLGLWAVAAVVPIIGMLLPGFARMVYVGMAYAAFPIGFVVSYIVLGLIYYCVLTPIGLIMRLLGYDPMRRRFDADAATYWTPRDGEREPERYFRQY